MTWTRCEQRGLEADGGGEGMGEYGRRGQEEGGGSLDP